MKIIECEQLSTLWWEARRGIPTASAFDRIIQPKKGLISASADGYVAELIAEAYVLPPPDQRPQSRAMQNGVECEPEARSFYALDTGADVQKVGFILDDNGAFGCSPDSLVGEDGVLEIKCPMPKTHVEYWLAGGLPSDYLPQCHGELIVTGRKWLDFMSYCPGMPPFVVRIEPNEFTDKLRAVMLEFYRRYTEAKQLFSVISEQKAVPA